MESMMVKTHRRRTWPQAAGLLILLLIGLMAVDLYGDEAPGDPGRADLITLDGMKLLRHELERAPVQFKHDTHTDVIKADGLDCSTCHLSETSGRLSQKFMRLADENYERTMEVYHSNCIGCHQRRLDNDQESGPVTCGDCHRRDPEYTDNRQPMGFDHSLHARHIAATHNKCESCHHEILLTEDEENEEAKRKPSSCRDCHLKVDSRDVPSMSRSAHWACLDCHRQLDAAGKSSGPSRCAGCHDAAKQAAWKIDPNPPRLDRDQPDNVIVSSGIQAPGAHRMKPVRFPHKAHEGYTDTCRACHHGHMQSCSTCHTLDGKHQGAGITLENAFHSFKLDGTCINCHEGSKKRPECAGCHAPMAQNEIPQSACTVCHGGDQQGSPTPKNAQEAEAGTAIAAQTFSFSPGTIPETVLIDSLESKYKGSLFPHRKVIDALLKGYDGKPGVAASRLAAVFHRTNDTLCQGCHHNTPVGQLPPSCTSCHSAPFDENNLNRPGLKGAYHLQCVGCHQKMGLDNLQGCSDCHKPHASKE